MKHNEYVCNNIELSFSDVIQIAREEWSGTLWANLDIEQLTNGIDDFMRRLKKFPKNIKSLPICRILEEKMKEFKESIPLFADLKNDALRDRYVFILISVLICYVNCTLGLKRTHVISMCVRVCVCINVLLT